MIKLQDLKVGQKYWCILASDETCSYEGEGTLRPPWEGIIQISSHGVHSLHRFDEKTGEIDYDTNASAVIAYERHAKCLFTSRRDAAEAYRQRRTGQIIREMTELADELGSLHDQVQRQQPDQQRLIDLAAAAPDLFRELRHLVRLLEPMEDNLSVPGLATLNGARAVLDIIPDWRTSDL